MHREIIKSAAYQHRIGGFLYCRCADGFSRVHSHHLPRLACDSSISSAILVFPVSSFHDCLASYPVLWHFFSKKHRGSRTSLRFLNWYPLLRGPSSPNLSHPNDHLLNRSLRSTRRLVFLLCGHRRGFGRTSLLWIPEFPSKSSFPSSQAGYWSKYWTSNPLLPGAIYCTPWCLHLLGMIYLYSPWIRSLNSANHFENQGTICSNLMPIITSDNHTSAPPRFWVSESAGLRFLGGGEDKSLRSFFS